MKLLQPPQFLILLFVTVIILSGKVLSHTNSSPPSCDDRIRSLLPIPQDKEYADFLVALRRQESIHLENCGEGGKGDGGDALGPFQIHKNYWIDALQWDDTIGGCYEDCCGLEYSTKVVMAYFERYGWEFIHKKDWENLSRIHNGGPEAWKFQKKESKETKLKRYWKSVSEHLKNVKAGK